MKLVTKTKGKAGKGGGTPAMILIFADPAGAGQDILVGHITKFVDTKTDWHPYQAYALKDWPAGGYPVWDHVGCYWPGETLTKLGQYADGLLTGGKAAAVKAVIAAAEAELPRVTKTEGACP